MARTSLMRCYWMLQNASVAAFTVSELLRGEKLVRINFELVVIVCFKTWFYLLEKLCVVLSYFFVIYSIWLIIHFNPISCSKSWRLSIFIFIFNRFIIFWYFILIVYVINLCLSIIGCLLSSDRYTFFYFLSSVCISAIK